MEETKYKKIKETKSTKKDEKNLIYYILIGIPFIISFIIAFFIIKIKTNKFNKKKRRWRFYRKMV